MDKQTRQFDEKKMIVFDLDGTLTESKLAMDNEMSKLLCRLLALKKVAVVSGGSYSQFVKQFLPNFKCDKKFLDNLILLPTSGSSFYNFKNGKWHRLYEHKLSAKEKKHIAAAFRKVYKDIDYSDPPKTYGEVIEDRKTQITFSALGQRAPLALKKKWNEKEDRRLEIRSALQKYIPEFEIRLGGKTSIDVTSKGITKAYAIRQIMKESGLLVEDIVFIGDEMSEAGNDFAVVRTGVQTITVSGPDDTKQFMSAVLAK